MRLSSMSGGFPEYTNREWTEMAPSQAMSLPFLIRGGCADWPAFTRLTFDYLRNDAGSAEVEVRRLVSGSDRTRQMALRDYLDYCETADEADPLYLIDWHYNEVIPHIRGWMKPPEAFRSWFDSVPPEARPGWSWIYIGPLNSRSRLHHDVKMTSAWNAVFSGSKEWVIFPPEHAYSVGLRRGQKIAAPASASDEAWSAVQHAGDLIYVPAGWAHSVTNRAAGIAFTENFVNESNWETVKRAAEESNDAEFLKILGLVRAVHSFSRLSAIHEKTAASSLPHHS